LVASSNLKKKIINFGFDCVLEEKNIIILKKNE
jgi:hypothetical protein